MRETGGETEPSGENRQHARQRAKGASGGENRLRNPGEQKDEGAREQMPVTDDGGIHKRLTAGQRRRRRMGRREMP